MGLVFLIDRPGYRLATDRKVVRRNEAAVVEEITRAYVRAQGEINAALANLDKVCAKASDDAYRKGIARAEQEVTRRWTLAEVERLQLLKSMQPALAEVIVDAVCLLGKEIDRQAFFARALEVLQGSLRTLNWARLRVNPQSIPAAEKALEEFDAQSGLGKLARVIGDDSVAEDACMLESELGTIDASLSTQLQAIRGALTDAVRLTVPVDEG